MLAYKALRIVVAPPIIRRCYSSDMKLSTLDYDEKSRIATLSLNRPPVNSLNLELLQEIRQNVTKAEQDYKCRGLVITSTTDGVFSAGLDILEMYKPNVDRARLFWSALQDAWLALYGTSVPTAAVINGHSPAGGCLLATSCEYRVMLPNYAIGLNETKLGIVAPRWFMTTMMSVIPRRVAERALNQGKMFTSDEALREGLVDEIASSKEDALTRCAGFFRTFDNTDRTARSVTKKQMRAEDMQGLLRNRSAEIEAFVQQISDPSTQQKLGLYLQHLKTKSTDKHEKQN